MSKAEEIRLGLRAERGEKGTPRKAEITGDVLLEMVQLMELVLRSGGLFSTYTSKDGNALAIRIKAGRDTRAYWIGPDDDAYTVIDRIRADWTLPEIDLEVTRAVERYAAQLAEDVRKTMKDV